MTKVLMVCLGNICRSPLAEGILKSKVDPKKVYVDSAGTAGYHVGELPDSRSIAVARKYGIDLTDQRSRKFTSSDFETFDLIFVMDQSNYQDIIGLARNAHEASKVKMILDAVPKVNSTNVPDPYYGGDQGFETVFRLLDSACDHIIATMLPSQMNP